MEGCISLSLEDGQALSVTGNAQQAMDKGSVCHFWVGRYSLMLDSFPDVASGKEWLVWGATLGHTWGTAVLGGPKEGFARVKTQLFLC